MDNELATTLSILRIHTGEANAISGKELARMLFGTENQTREVRSIIHELREQGEEIVSGEQTFKIPVPVLKSPRGYFLPNNLDEANLCCDNLMNHAISEIVTRGNIIEALPAYFENAKARRLL